MGRLLNVVTPLHKRTRRDYLARMVDDKVACMLKAKEYESDYWDGDRRFGYGGYRYDGRWKVVAEQLIETYDLRDGARILDVGLLVHLALEVAELRQFEVKRPAEIRHRDTESRRGRVRQDPGTLWVEIVHPSV